MDRKYYSKGNAQAEKVLRLRQQNLSVEHIAKMMCITKGCVKKYISYAKTIDPVQCDKCGEMVLHLERFKKQNLCTDCMLNHDSIADQTCTLEYQMACGNKIHPLGTLF